MPRISSLAFHDIRCEAFAIFCSTTEGVSADFLSSMCQRNLRFFVLNYKVIFSGVGAFNHLFGPGRGKFEKKFKNFKCPGGCPGWGC